MRRVVTNPAETGAPFANLIDKYRFIVDGNGPSILRVEAAACRRAKIDDRVMRCCVSDPSGGIYRL